MLNMSIGSCGVYRNAEKCKQTIHCPWLALHVTGLVYSRLYTPEGRLVAEHGRGDAYLQFSLPGMGTNFEYDSNRENWVVMFNEIPLRLCDGVPDQLEMRDEGAWLPVPVCKNVSPEELPAIQSDMRRICDCLSQPLPVNRLEAKLIVLGFLKFMVAGRGGTVAETPAGHLKRLIDEDDSFRKTLVELSSACSYSRDHLRLLFQQEFQISPSAYRAQKRMARVMELISGTTMSIKEISDLTGFEHPSHLSMAFKKAFGSTPMASVKKFRYKRA